MTYHSFSRLIELLLWQELCDIFMVNNHWCDLERGGGVLKTVQARSRFVVEFL